MNRRFALLATGLGLLLSTLPLGGLTGCAAAPAEIKPLPPRQGLVLPTGDGGFVVLGPGRATRYSADEEVLEWSGAKDLAQLGAPRDAALDLHSGLACVAYGEKLAVLELGGEMVFLVDNPAPEILSSLMLHDQLLALTAGSRVWLLEVPAGKVLVDGVDFGPWIAPHDVRTLARAYPVDENRLLLVAYTAQTMMRDGRIRTLRADRSTGSWEYRGGADIPGYAAYAGCYGDGERLRIAVRFEEAQLGTNRLWQSFRLFDVAPETGEIREIGQPIEAGADREKTLREFCGGTNSMAMLFAPDELIIRELDGGEPWSSGGQAIDAVAWISESSYVFLSNGEPTLIRHH